jgi:rod shape-determining protein MreD
MSETFEVRAMGETHIEVHKFRGGAILAAVLASLVLQALIPIYIPRAAMLDLPLLITLYFGLSRRNPVTGLGLGMVIGLVQDSLSKSPLGIYGIAKTLVGYIASSIGGRLDTEHPLSRFALTVVFFGLHQGVIVLTKRVLLAQPEVWFTMKLGIAAGVNAIVAVGLFFLLDRLRKQ